MGITLTGNEIIEFIKQHDLKKAEIDVERLTGFVDLPDGTWLDYDIEKEYVKHFPKTEDWKNVPKNISYEEAKMLRTPKVESPMAMFKKFIFPTLGVAEAFKEKIEPLCTELGKGSSHKSKCYIYHHNDIYHIDGYYVYAKLTKEALNDILAKYPFEAVHVDSKTYYVVISKGDE